MIGSGGIDKKPVPEAQYRQDFPETPGPAPEDEEACQQQETLDVGLTWAAVTLAEKNGIRAHLHEVSGRKWEKSCSIWQSSSSPAADP